MECDEGKYRESKLFFTLAAAGVAAALFHVHIPYTDVLIDGRWAFGFMGFALLRHWRAALALAALLSYPYGTPDIPLWVGFGGNMLYAVPSLVVMRPLSDWMRRRWGPGWCFGACWLAMVLLCYQAFITPVVWGVSALLHGRSLGTALIDGWQTQPYLVESILVALLSAAALVAVLSLERLRAEQRRLGHIYRVLLGIRNVNQLIVAENDPGRLIERACINMTETMGYHNAWIALLGGEPGRTLGLPEAGPVAAAAAAGFDGGFERMRERLERGEFPDCMKRALASEAALATDDPAADCPDCPLSGHYDGAAGLARRLEFGGVTWGVLAASIPGAYARDAEEQDLFNEVAGDIAFALHKITAERELRARDQRYARLAAHIPGVVFQNLQYGDDPTRDEFAYISPGVRDLFGLAPDEVMRDSSALWALIHPEDMAAIIDSIQHAMETGARWNHDFRITTSGGESKWVRGMASQERRPDGSTLWDGLLLDITERKRAEEALRESEAWLEETMRIALVGGWKIDLSGNTLAWTDETFRIHDLPVGVPPNVDEAIAFYHADDRPRVSAVVQHAIENSESYDFEARIITARQNLKWVRSIGHANVHEGRTAFVWGPIQDITDLKQAEDALRRSEGLFQAMLAAIPDMISIHDTEMNVVYSNWNGFAAVPPDRRILGEKCYRIYRGRDTVCPDCRAKHVIETLEPHAEEVELPEGGWYELNVIPILDADGNCELFVEWVSDITGRKSGEAERERLGEQLLQAQKMESVGRLAGGVAHDFNNMLNVILGHAEIMFDDLPFDSPLRDDLSEMRKAAERSADLTRQLLAFARKQTVAPKDLDLNETVAAMLKMLQRLIGEDIDLLWKPGTRPARVRIDPGQVDQVLANLAVNARDAIGHQNGKITIETANVAIDEDYCVAHLGAVPGSYVMLAVSDDGCGMDEETRAQIFEPFFTTKGVGEGTGLGLATIYGIVKQNDGFVNVYSELGKGTTFRIYLPALDAESGQQDDARHAEAAPTAGNETILIVEDETAVLEISRAMLERLGYTVLAASTPSDAVGMVRAQPGGIDLLITDVIMPEMDGRELARNLRESCPSLRILFMSGYTADVIAHHGILDKGVNFIQKPFSREQLALKVREVLEG